jgi:hypothetical protein
MLFKTARRFQELEQESARLKCATGELTVDKLVLKETDAGNGKALTVAGPVWIPCGRASWSLCAMPAVSWANREPRNDINRSIEMTKNR